ncbi:hypothetical protein SHIRM173S_01475 [Streptomyces hirsutus]
MPPTSWSGAPGICYAKAHALAALLRAEDIPTALCYQDLGVVHGLVAVRFHGAWHRQDPRGNKPGVDARFSLDGERRAVRRPIRPPVRGTARLLIAARRRPYDGVGRSEFLRCQGLHAPRHRSGGRSLLRAGRVPVTLRCEGHSSKRLLSGNELGVLASNI